ncbi:MAG: helix-turn-helix domain-containing protein [Planctomycetes bacterium]|nr:helix-turn-helix domain-containing protein [Planctomycetota bacterium]
MLRTINSRLRHVPRHINCTLRGLRPRPPQESRTSLSRYAHLFTEEVGCSRMHYRESMRMNCTQQLLVSTNRKIQDIATELAYDRPFHFSRRLKQHCGQSPKHYRLHISQ